jgi:hypothetical protein
MAASIYHASILRAALVLLDSKPLGIGHPTVRGMKSG